MGLFSICPKDPLITLLKNTFKANPIKIPEERIVPLGVIIKKESNEAYWGDVINLLTDKSPYPEKPTKSKMPDMSDTKSKAVDFNLGFKILDGFLKGMGVGSSELKTKFNGVKKISFTFHNVNRSHIDIGKLGAFLEGKKLKKENPANNLLFQNKAKFIVIDSTIVSKNFSIDVEESSISDFSFDIDGINQIIGKVDNNISINSSNKLNISFSGKKSLAFAFTGVVLDVAQDGTIGFTPDNFDSQQKKTSEKGNLNITPDTFLFYEEDGLIEFEEKIN